MCNIENEKHISTWFVFFERLPATIEKKSTIWFPPFVFFQIEKNIPPSPLLAEAAPSSATNTCRRWPASTPWACCSKAKENSLKRNRFSVNAWRRAGGSEIGLVSGRKTSSCRAHATWILWLSKNSEFDLMGGLGGGQKTGIPGTCWIFADVLCLNCYFGFFFGKTMQIVNAKTRPHNVLLGNQTLYSSGDCGPVPFDTMVRIRFLLQQVVGLD